MNRVQRQALIAALILLLVAACGWGWFALFEKRWEARRHHSEALRDNPMLAASRLLSGRGAAVSTEATLREALLKPLPAGTLLIARSGGLVSAEQAGRLLDWVRQGNTLIVQPKWRSDAQDDAGTGKKPRAKKAAEPVETDPIGARFGVVRTSPADTACDCKDPDPGATGTEGSAAKPAKPAKSSKPPAVRPANLTLPGASYPLQLEAAYSRLFQAKPDPVLRYGDDTGESVRIYAEGRGHVVLLAQNYFSNHYLGRHDHAEMLLNLTRLGAPEQGRATHFVIVQALDMAKWYSALWSNFSKGLIGIGCVLLLLLWSALRRFGPTLPEPAQERRSLIEHIEASGRWLWNIPGGREILLASARAAGNKAWQRRAPDLLRLHPDRQIERLAAICNLAAADLASALREPAGKTPAAFTRQIQTLRQLRKTYER